MDNTPALAISEMWIAFFGKRENVFLTSYVATAA